MMAGSKSASAMPRFAMSGAILGRRRFSVDLAISDSLSLPLGPHSHDRSHPQGTRKLIAPPPRQRTQQSVLEPGTVQGVPESGTVDSAPSQSHAIAIDVTKDGIQGAKAGEHSIADTDIETDRVKVANGVYIYKVGEAYRLAVDPKEFGQQELRVGGKTLKYEDGQFKGNLSFKELADGVQASMGGSVKVESGIYSPESSETKLELTNIQEKASRLYVASGVPSIASRTPTQAATTAAPPSTAATATTPATASVRATTPTQHPVATQPSAAIPANPPEQHSTALTHATHTGAIITSTSPTVGPSQIVLNFDQMHINTKTLGPLHAIGAHGVSLEFRGGTIEPSRLSGILQGLLEAGLDDKVSLSEVEGHSDAIELQSATRDESVLSSQISATLKESLSAILVQNGLPADALQITLMSEEEIIEITKDKGGPANGLPSADLRLDRAPSTDISQAGGAATSREDVVSSIIPTLDAPSAQLTGQPQDTDTPSDQSSELYDRMFGPVVDIPSGDAFVIAQRRRAFGDDPSASGQDRPQDTSSTQHTDSTMWGGRSGPFDDMLGSDVLPIDAEGMSGQVSGEVTLGELPVAAEHQATVDKPAIEPLITSQSMDALWALLGKKNQDAMLSGVKLVTTDTREVRGGRASSGVAAPVAGERQSSGHEI